MADDATRRPPASTTGRLRCDIVIIRAVADRSEASGVIVPAGST